MWEPPCRLHQPQVLDPTRGQHGQRPDHMPHVWFRPRLRPWQQLSRELCTGSYNNTLSRWSHSEQPAKQTCSPEGAAAHLRCWTPAAHVCGSSWLDAWKSTAHTLLHSTWTQNDGHTDANRNKRHMQPEHGRHRTTASAEPPQVAAPLEKHTHHEHHHPQQQRWQQQRQPGCSPKQTRTIRTTAPSSKTVLLSTAHGDRLHTKRIAVHLRKSKSNAAPLAQPASPCLHSCCGSLPDDKHAQALHITHHSHNHVATVLLLLQLHIVHLALGPGAPTTALLQQLTAARIAAAFAASSSSMLLHVRNRAAPHAMRKVEPSSGFTLSTHHYHHTLHTPRQRMGSSP
jgi:hypothetical protein